MIKPKALNKGFLNKLNNETISFYIQRFDRDEFNQRPKYSFVDFKNLKSKNKILYLPFNSENTKINQKGDSMVFKLETDEVGEKLYKRFVTSKVRAIS